MSQGNVEIVQRLYDEFLSDPDRLSSPEILRFFDPDVEVRQAASLVGTDGTFHGHDGLARSVREQFDVWRRLHFVPLRLVENGDQVVATVKAHAYGKDSGVEVSETIAHVWRLRRGRIVAIDVYWDVFEALEAVGLRE